jgi:hypothetical protein
MSLRGVIINDEDMPQGLIWFVCKNHGVNPFVMMMMMMMNCAGEGGCIHVYLRYFATSLINLCSTLFVLFSKSYS